jgi:hypothetical protein
VGEHSIEHNLNFNTAKRVLRFVDPVMNVVATRELTSNQSVLDLTLNVLRVPEGQPMRAVGMVLFYSGIMRLRNTQWGLTSVFGHINRALLESDLVELCAKEHSEVDNLAFDWAIKQFTLLFPEVEPARAQTLVDQRMSFLEWKEYFLEK